MSRTAGTSGEVSRVRSRQLQGALAAFAEEAAARLRAVLAAGEEVPFELASRSSRGRAAAPLYSYRPLTAEFVAQRFGLLLDLGSHALAANLLAQLDGLDRYLLACGADRNAGSSRAWAERTAGSSRAYAERTAGGSRAYAERTAGSSRAYADAALLAFLQDVFGEQTDFELRPERLTRALERIDGSAVADPALLTLLATLHGIAIASEELRLTGSLLLAQPHALDDLPTGSLSSFSHAPNEHQPLLVVCTSEDADPHQALDRCHETLSELLRGLRLFGDGRIALSPAGHCRIGSGPWATVALPGVGGHPHGMLLVTPEQEDELRAFCNLISRRAPREGPSAWALRRYELGCERAREYEALSDHLLVLRALLGATPEGVESAAAPDGLIASRLAALCAMPEQRSQLAERTLGAFALERAFVMGVAVEHAGGLQLARELSDHLRALLRDQICGHLPHDLAGLGDELLLSGEDPEQVLGDEPQPVEVLDLAI